MKNNTKRRCFAVLKLMCAVLALCMAFGVLPLFATENPSDTGADAKSKTVQVVVAAKDIAVGTVLTDSHVKVVTVSNENVPGNVISNIDEAVSKYASVDLYEGEYIYAEQISSKKVERVNNDLLVKDITSSDDDFVVVTDYVVPDTGKDVTTLLQKIIDENPQRTIYFPKGEYIISSPLYTAASGNNSVSLQLADGAVIKASKAWKSQKLSISVGSDPETRTVNSLIALGAGEPKNDIVAFGSYFSIKGGTLDGNGVADCLSIESGREIQVRNICLVNFAKKGLHISRGANSNSSDCDFEDITIIGNGTLGTIGINFVGYDNTITNVRIYNCETGIDSTTGAGNLFKNIYFYNDPEICRIYKNTTAFLESAWSNNWISECYAENYAVAFNLGTRTVISDCWAKWTSDLCTDQTFIKVNGPEIAISGCRVEFYGAEANTAFVKFAGSNAATKMIEGCFFDESLCDNKDYVNCLKTPVIPIS